MHVRAGYAPLAAMPRHHPPELWFRAAALEGLARCTTTATVRFGRRDASHPKGYVVGERVLVRCLTDHDGEILRCWVTITALTHRTVGALTDRDLTDGFPRSEESVEAVRHLFAGHERRTISNNEEVTIVRFRYEETP